MFFAVSSFIANLARSRFLSWDIWKDMTSEAYKMEKENIKI